MTVTTIEDLEALPVGEQVEVRSDTLGRKVWDRVEGGMQADDGVTVLPLSLFVGAVNDRRIGPLPAEPVVGALYTEGGYSDGRYQYLVVTVDTELRRCECLYFRRTEFRALRARSFDQLRELSMVSPESYPVWYRPALMLGTRWLEADKALTDLRARLRELAES